MELKELRTFLKKEKESSLYEMSRTLHCNEKEIETQLEILISLNKVQKKNNVLEESSCIESSCSGCSCSGTLMPSITPNFIYSWIG